MTYHHLTLTLLALVSLAATALAADNPRDYFIELSGKDVVCAGDNFQITATSSWKDGTTTPGPISAPITSDAGVTVNSPTQVGTCPVTLTVNCTAGTTPGDYTIRCKTAKKVIHVLTGVAGAWTRIYTANVQPPPPGPVVPFTHVLTSTIIDTGGAGGTIEIFTTGTTQKTYDVVTDTPAISTECGQKATKEVKFTAQGDVSVSLYGVHLSAGVEVSLKFTEEYPKTESPDPHQRYRATPRVPRENVTVVTTHTDLVQFGVTHSDNNVSTTVVHLGFLAGRDHDVDAACCTKSE